MIAVGVGLIIFAWLVANLTDLDFKWRSDWRQHLVLWPMLAGLISLLSGVLYLLWAHLP